MTQQLLFWAFTQEKNRFTQNLYRNVPGSFICNSPKLEATQMTFNSRMVKRTVVQDTTEYNLAIKRNKLLIHATIDNRMNLYPPYYVYYRHNGFHS